MPQQENAANVRIFILHVQELIKLQENGIDWLTTWLDKSLIIEAVIGISETRKLVNNKLEL